MKTNNKGFSLVELIVVIAIMAILAAVAIPTFATFIQKANEASDIDFMNGVEYAAELACAGEAQKVTKIEVVLSAEKGNATSVEVTIDGVTDPVVVTETGNSGADKDFKDLIAGSIDWDYDFKAKKADLEANDNWKDDADNDDVLWTLTIDSN